MNSMVEHGIDFAAGRRTFFNQRVADQLARRTDGDEPDDYDVDGDEALGGPLLDPDVVGKPANLICSDLEGGTDIHKPCLDIDVPCLVVPSSTPGHCHLYFDKPVPWVKFEKLLVALGDCGIADPEWVAHSIKKRRACLRPPGVVKVDRDEADQRRIAQYVADELEYEAFVAKDGPPKPVFTIDASDIVL